MSENKDAIMDLARLFTETRYEDLSEASIEAAKKLIIDIMATTTAGSTALIVPEVAKYFMDMGGKEEASVLVYGKKIPAANAALVNALAGHARDWDDTLEDAVIHETVTLIPTVLAVAEAEGNVSGKEFIKAIVVGCDVMSRLCYGTEWGTAESGYVFTALMAYFGCAMAASYLKGHTAEQIANAAGIVLSQCAGALQAVKDAVLAKRLQPAFGAHAGVQAANLTGIGVTGSRNVLDGEKSFYQVYFRGHYDREALLKDLGTFWHIENLSFKPYPCCRYTHCAIDTAKLIREKYDIKPDEIISIDAGTSVQGFGSVCAPEEVRKHPSIVVEAQFSIPFTVSSVFVNGDVNLDSFSDENFKNPEVLELCQKFNLSVDAEVEEKFHDGCPPTRLTVHTTRGDFSEVVWRAKGSIESMMTMDEIVDKYYSTKTWAAYPVKEGAFENIVAIVKDLENVENVNVLIDAVNNAFDRD
jgi:2-methylcitrate dehydratase PrpD